MKNFIFIIALFIAFSASAQTNIAPIIPQPLNVEINQGTFDISKLKGVRSSSDLKNETTILIDYLKNLGYNLKEARGKKNTISLNIDTKLEKESYNLIISKNSIAISGGDRAGVFYGIQSLIQIIRNSNNTLICYSVSDKPRYVWRGLMIDESRHFFGKEKILESLDMMAMLKLNRFHWHLTDEPGWRIEIPQYPKLTTIGGKGSWSNPNDPVNYYTKEEIKEIVAYANARHITVIPEIDMPGHASAAVRSYPEYGGGGTKAHPDYTFNVGKEDTYVFLTNILRQTAKYFNSPYMHIGGDELAFGIEAWKTNSDIQKLIKDKNLKDVKGAEAYFMRRMADSIQSLNKTQIAWDEILDLNLSPEKTIVMWWRHDRPYLLDKSLKKGYSTILSPRRPLYFDFIQHKTHRHGRTWNGFCPPEDVYNFPDKTIDLAKFSEEELSHILGVEACMWTERIHNTDRFDFMLYTRLCALSEAGWSVENRKNYDTFAKNMEMFYKLFDKMGLYYFDARDAQKHIEPKSLDKNALKKALDFRD